MKLTIQVALLAACVTTAAWACDLKVEGAWIREAPPNAMALAGYAKLSNTGAATLKIQSVTSAAFASVEAHQSVTENGMAMMRPLTVEIPANSSVEFAVGGKHFMLMQPKQPLKKGDVVNLVIKDAAGCASSVPFKVRATTGNDEHHDHSNMDHSMMDHSKMDHEK